MPDQTPMMRQYSRIKQQHRDAVLFFRLGDFYEMFGNDAKEASRILGLTLTKRHGIPMCGIPYHASASYISKLLNAGKKIAICEQVKMPESGKGLADREVVEIISPGTALDDDFLDSTNNNYLLALGKFANHISYSYIDVSTGEFFVNAAPAEQAFELIKKELSRLDPREILIQESLYEEDSGIGRLIAEREGLLVNRFPDWSFDIASSRQRLLRQYGVANLKGFGVDDTGYEILTAAVLLDYLEENAKALLPHIRDLVPYNEDDYVLIDESSARNLELRRNMRDGSSRYTLIEVLDYTKTAMGGRLLKKWIMNPLVDKKKIDHRLTITSGLYHNQFLLSSIREELSNILDIERLASKLALDKAHAKDLLAIKNSLEGCNKLEELSIAVLLDEGIYSNEELKTRLSEIRVRLEKSIMESPSVLLTEGNLIREGYNQELDKLRKLKENSRSVLDTYLKRERKESGIVNLKLRYNKIIGHYLEVSKGNLPRVPEHFIRRQSLVNSERFTTEELSELESELNNATEKIIELERDLFLEIRGKTKDCVKDLLLVSDRLAFLDCLQSFAYTATRSGYTKPEIRTDQSIHIISGRHPVVEAYSAAGDFVPNDIIIDTDKEFFALVTGPNMAGKSTFLRQTALIVLMAQIGSFVPADEAQIGIVDRLFCRVGASDNLARGESTFLVEMNETANILRRASKSSLIIMDEVGRGTSTDDGLAIAQAVSEYILNTVNARTLFASHFHELCTIEHPRLINLSLSIVEDRGEIIFLKKVVKGPSNRSYGLHVARLAGLPDAVIIRAKEILDTMFSDKQTKHQTLKSEEAKGKVKETEQKDLFSPQQIVIDKLMSFDLNSHSPIETLNFLNQLKNDLRS